MSGMVVLAVLVAGIVSTLTDWLFMGVLFHDRYSRYPEVWREGIVGGQERTAVIYSAALGFVTAAAIVALEEATCTFQAARNVLAGAGSHPIVPPGSDRPHLTQITSRGDLLRFSRPFASCDGSECSRFGIYCYEQRS